MKKSLIKLVAVSSAALALGGVLAPVASVTVEAAPSGQSSEFNQKLLADALADYQAAYDALYGPGRDGSGAIGNLKTAEADRAAKIKALADAQANYDKLVAELASANAELTDAKAAEEAADRALITVTAEYNAEKAAIEEALKYNADTLAKYDSEEAQGHAAVDATKAELVAAENNAQVAYDSAVAVNAGIVVPATDAVNYEEVKAQKDAAELAEFNAASVLADAVAANAAYDVAAEKAAVTAAVEAKKAKLDDVVDNTNNLDGEYFAEDNGLITQAKAKLDAATARREKAQAEVSRLDVEVATALTALNTAKTAKLQADGSVFALQAEVNNQHAKLVTAVVTIQRAAGNENIRYADIADRFSGVQQDLFEELYGKSSEELEAEGKAYADSAQTAKENLENLKDGNPDFIDPDYTDVDTDGEGNEVTPPVEETPGEETPGEDDNNNGGSNNGNGSNNGGSNNGSGQAELPETGESSSYAIFGAAALAVLAGVGLVAPSFKKEN
ncbi:LPXTG cell wall anchor domain-containing protein [Aerococcaceae bacterium DSM 111021]|nr:LPXTG cell wall anchor domain-containing protein [Aerococcaceae bacterium DSM 111021]